jgi:hypothetical protein
MNLITIDNNGQAIADTNYFGTPQAQAGYCFFSWNAGAGRLLVPDARRSWLREMSTAEYVIVSRGPWQDQGHREAMELLFEDGSDRPFSIHLLMEQTDRTLPDTDQGNEFVITIWTLEAKTPTERLRFPAKYRVVDKIPCLDPWP